MIKFLISTATVLIATSANAQVLAKPDLAKGGAIANQVCAACHAADGNATGAANPKLAGQHPEYLAKQLHNFKAGKDGKPALRANAVMAGFAGALSDEDIANVAAYYGAQAIKPASGKNADLKKQGEKIWRGGIADKGIAACASCHGANGKGIPVQYPRLSGQWGEYTEAQLTAFRQGVRKNNAQMTSIAAKLSDAEIKAVSDYAASLR
jgi:cbb3-type cytochrome c oxidase subunit III